jgi:SAM-dependent methyltransferase
MSEFLNLSDKHVDVLKRMLSDSLNKNMEFEIRFGKFYQDQGKEKYKSFESNFEIENYYKLKKMLRKVEHEEVITDEYIYKNPTEHGNIKRIVNKQDSSETFMVKNVAKTYDIYDYDIRFSSSYEKGYDKSKIDDLENYDLVRRKSRTSYKFGFGKLDLTIVKQEFKNGKTQFKYEVEFEISNFDINSILGTVTFILQTRQDSFYVISNMERRYVLSEYRNLINANYFIGAQPETLHKEKISMLYKNYSVTDKADGERAFMIIDKIGNLYFIDNNLNKVTKTNLNSKKYTNTLIDGEIVKQNDKIVFLAFDLVFYNGKDLRNNTEYKLKQRLDRLNHILLTVESNQFYLLKLKKYYYNNVFLGSKIILDNVDQNGDYKLKINDIDIIYKNDGLVYTPMDEPYPKSRKWTSLLKWKPAELTTIDFYSKKISSENGLSRWQLFVQHPVESVDKTDKIKNVTETVLFDISKLCSIENGTEMTYETVFSDSLIDETTAESYKTNTVIEYKWDKLEKHFVPIRTRWDKTINPKKHGNFSEVACDIWNNINNPIEKETLFKFKNISSNSDFFFERMRRFHNKVKEYLYNKYCKDTEYLLELCSGKGGDLHKWIHNDIKNVYGYDVSDKNITECNRRVQTLQSKSPIVNNYKFFKLDLTTSNSYEIIYKNNQTLFNTICCHFGIHYFFESEKYFNNILEILNTVLVNNGYFIVTFMDNEKIDELFNNKDMCYYEKDNEILYLLERQNTPSIYGNKLNITLNGNNILSDGSEEWIINFNNFKTIMESNGYKCIESDLFKNLYDSTYDLQDFEFDISFLNRYCVFQKINSDNLEYSNTDKLMKMSNQIIDEISNINTQFNFDTINLHQNDISVYKVSSLYDIIDTINCIEYKYYKNTVSNKIIESHPNITFNDIITLFNDLNIIYQPIFVSDPLNFENYKDNINNIYFTYYKHMVEKRNNEITNENEDIEYNNWYIIMYKDQLLFNKPKNNIDNKEIELEITENEINKKIESEITENEINKNIENEINKENEIVNENSSKFEINNDEIKEKVKMEWEKIKNTNKITIKILKELLLKLDLKVSGKKDEMQKRLENRLNNSLF